MNPSRGHKYGKFQALSKQGGACRNLPYGSHDTRTKIPSFERGLIFRQGLFIIRTAGKIFVERLGKNFACHFLIVGDIDNSFLVLIVVACSILTSHGCCCQEGGFQFVVFFCFLLPILLFLLLFSEAAGVRDQKNRIAV